VKAALLLAGLSADGPTTVRERTPTRIHTEEMLATWGARVDVSRGAVTVHPGPLHSVDFMVPGDPSQAAFWVVAACLVAGSDLTVEGVYVGPQRATFLDVLRRMGADIDVVGIDPSASVADIRIRSGPLVGTEVGGDEIAGLIDEIPVLAVAATRAEGTTTFRDAAELKVKESDRIASMVAALTAVGAEAEGRADGLIVTGADRPLPGGQVDSVGDHRVAMALAVAALAAAGPVRIDDWDAVATSYPGFEEDMRSCLAR
jgi:3-phosphoshikimate 1-carboxyvinyltransferase